MIRVLIAKEETNEKEVEEDFNPIIIIISLIK